MPTKIAFQLEQTFSSNRVKIIHSVESQKGSDSVLNSDRRCTFLTARFATNDGEQTKSPPVQNLELKPWAERGAAERSGARCSTSQRKQDTPQWRCRSAAQRVGFHSSAVVPLMAAAASSGFTSCQNTASSNRCSALSS